MDKALTSSRTKKGGIFPPGLFSIWAMLQAVVWLIGLSIFASLIFIPSTGLLVFWNMLIPVAPALLVLGTGIWRNICPLATTTLLPRHWHVSRRKKMSVALQGRLQLAAVLALFGIVPLRHILFNRSGPSTALLLSVLASTGFVMGIFFDWKSGWCSSLCPVHPVEKLYGGNPVYSFANAHCTQCVNCSIPCPDSTPNFRPAMAARNYSQRLAGWLITGGLPGFIWGWFHVSDQPGRSGRADLLQAYAMPLAGLLVTLCLYMLLKTVVHKTHERQLSGIFAASGVSCYYWYRIPALLGFGPYSGDGLLISLRDVIPSWSATALALCTTLFFFWWLLVRKPSQKSWVIRPPYAPRTTQ